MLLFGSRCRGDHRPGSDLDVFAEDVRELLWFHPHVCVEFGGPVDAFWDPGECEWTEAVLNSDRLLAIRDKWGPTVETRPITREDFSNLVDEACRQRGFDEPPSPPATLEAWRTALIELGQTVPWFLEQEEPG